MTQLSERCLSLAVDHVTEHGSFKAAADYVNISESNFYAWRAKSKRDCESGDTSSPFYFNHNGDVKWWHEALATARDVFLFSQDLSVIEEQPKRPSYAKPLKPPQPSQAHHELRALAALTPEQRRAKFGASAYPLDANGRRTIPRLSPSLTADQADDEGHGLRPGPEPFRRPQQSKYANPNILPPGSGRSVQRLDVGEQIGDGQDQIPSGGFRVA